MNARRERFLRRRLRAWGAATAPTFKVIGRDKAPALTDAAAWQAFPLATHDVVIIDSIDAATEGVGEGDSAKPAKALAPILDLARRDDGPAILVLGNVIKSGAHSRGCGIIEDRADIVYEVRDATDLRPSGTKDWWHELPAADVAAWALRASRRKRRDVYRLAFVPSKFRLGEEPEPFIFEIDHRPTPWALRDVTGEVVAAGEAAREDAEAERVATAERAIGALGLEVQRRAEAGEIALAKGDAEALLQAKGLKRKAARTALLEGVGQLWEFVDEPAGGPGKPRVTRVSLSRRGGPSSERPGLAAEEEQRERQRGQWPGEASHSPSPRIWPGERSTPREPASAAGIRRGLLPPPSGNIHPREPDGKRAAEPQIRTEWIE